MKETIGTTYEIFRRELKAYFESPVAYVFLAAFLILINIFTFARYLGNFYETGEADLRPFFLWHPWVYLLLVPAAAMRLWSEERKSGTIELLLTLPVTLTQAVVGKFLAAWTFLGIALALTFPIGLTTSIWLGGDLDRGAVVCGYLGSFLVAGTYLSVGMWTSALTRNQVISFVLAAIINLFLLLAGWPLFTDLFVNWAPGVVKATAAFSVLPHYESIQRGVIDLRDVVYYLSMIAVMLFATQVTLQNRKSA